MRFREKLSELRQHAYFWKEKNNQPDLPTHKHAYNYAVFPFPFSLLFPRAIDRRKWRRSKIHKKSGNKFQGAEVPSERSHGSLRGVMSSVGHGSRTTSRGDIVGRTGRLITVETSQGSVKQTPGPSSLGFIPNSCSNRPASKLSAEVWGLPEMKE